MLAVAAQINTQHRDDRRSRLREIISDKSLIKGREMRLASGRLTDIYFDLKPTMLDQEASNLLADEILDVVRAIDFDSIGGLAIGAVPLIQSVIVKSYGKIKIRAFFVRSELKEHGTKELIEANFQEGDRVVILDDVTTTGGSVLKAIDAVRSRGANVLSVITIVDRQEGAEDKLARSGIRLIPLFNKQDFQ